MFATLIFALANSCASDQRFTIQLVHSSPRCHSTHIQSAADIYVIQRLPKFFNQAWSSHIGYQITTSLSVQLLGYGLAGITRRFLVYPTSCIWPANLGTIALNRAFHREKNLSANGWKMSKLMFFVYAFCGMCKFRRPCSCLPLLTSIKVTYYVFPGLIFPALSYFNWTTWIAPNNVNLAAITGTISGLGINPVPTLDWSQSLLFRQFAGNSSPRFFPDWQIADPIITPLFSTLNQYIGALIAIPIIVGIWYTNTFNTGTSFANVPWNATWWADPRTRQVTWASTPTGSSITLGANTMSPSFSLRMVYSIRPPTTHTARRTLGLVTSLSTSVSSHVRFPSYPTFTRLTYPFFSVHCDHLLRILVSPS